MSQLHPEPPHKDPVSVSVNQLMLECCRMVIRVNTSLWEASFTCGFALTWRSVSAPVPPPDARAACCSWRRTWTSLPSSETSPCSCGRRSPGAFPQRPPWRTHMWLKVLLIWTGNIGIKGSAGTCSLHNPSCSACPGSPLRAQGHWSPESKSQTGQKRHCQCLEWRIVGALGCGMPFCSLN